MDDAGFKDVTRWADAREVLRSVCDPHGRTERVAVAEAVDRVLASPVAAERDVPHYDRAAMDGFAVQARDTHGASQRSPATFAILDDGPVSGDTAIPVNTGDVVPDGADAVVMVEYTDRRNGSLEVADAVATGENVAPAGEDVEAGQRLFDAGHRLQPSDLALLRAAGQEDVDVAEPPRVSVLPTGDELVAAGEEPAPGQTVETNGLLVSTLAERWGGDATYRDVVRDDEDALRNAIETDADHDVVVTTGGSSVGDRDVVADVVADAGEVLVHGVSIRPGHPVGFGVVDETPVLMLPGYPVSCLVTAVQFLRPATAWLAGTATPPRSTSRARLAGKLPSTPGERTFARVQFVDDARGHEYDGADDDGSADGDEGNDLPRVEPLRIGGAGVMSSVAFADGWVVVPESREGIPAGEVVAVEAWERPEVTGSNRS